MKHSFAKQMVIGAALFCVSAMVMVVDASSVSAQSNIFQISVPVEIEGANAATVRETALSQAQATGAREIMKRMVLEEDWPKLQAPSEADAGSLVQTVEIQNERASAAKYSATFVLRYLANGLRQRLRQSGVRYAETLSRPVLILPVLRSGEGVRLWDQSNGWHAGWLAMPPRNGLVPMIVPVGDATDLAEIGGDREILKKPNRLLAIARRYGANDAIVVDATLTTNASLGRPVVNVRADQFGALPKKGLVSEQFASDSKATPVNQILAQAADKVAARIEENWKRTNLVSFGAEQAMTVVVPISSLGEWIKIRQRLDDVPLLRRYSLNSMSRAEARVNLGFLGTPEQLQIALAQKDLSLVQTASGVWAVLPSGPIQ